MSTNTDTTAAPSTRTTRSASEDALWAALTDHPGSTTAELAEAASVAKSSARKILTGWAADQLITRDHTGDDPRAGHRWIIPATEADTPETDTPASESETDNASAPDDADPATDAATDPAPATDPQADAEMATPGSEQAGDPPASDTAPTQTAADPTAPVEGVCPTCARPLPKSKGLQPGALRGLVEDFLRDHPGQEFTPGQIAKELDRSSGAVYNALFSLVGKYVAEETCERPHKFRLHPDQEN
ncbi:MarR family transcriptional regulator [Nocardia otitidiscaviarum]|uniref:MarR family transcriptional regulator n=1 Tax=Nocardia otitidiscaviarum TaxID=1823 RepID=UPI0018960355|nr:MarR family transcriptional regulator [Nocardia otitidiscaviarum]MBF6238708.1 MarR family transcriptional regulator [Nocardia otitidiscaviarum]